MFKFLNVENPFFRFMGRVADAILINFLWIIFSLPVVTLGAASSALYETFDTCVIREEGTVFATFLTVFKRRILRSILTTLAYELFIGGGLAVILLGYSRGNSAEWLGAIYLFVGILMAVALSMAMYTFFLLRHAKLTPIREALFALVLTIRHLPRTLLALGVFLGIQILLDWFPYAILFASAGFCFLIRKPFEKTAAAYPQYIVREELL